MKMKMLLALLKTSKCVSCLTLSDHGDNMEDESCAVIHCS